MVTSTRKRVFSLASFFLIAGTLAYTQTKATPQQQTETAAGRRAYKPILDYISNGWDVLTRSMEDCTTIVDPKLAGKSILYVPADYQVPESVTTLEGKCGVEIKALPKVIHHLGQLDPSTINPQGLLYLDHPYLVPGGRFNEMYGWDSYFILRGLLRAGKIDLGKGMVENFYFEIEHYGAVLNANRTYYLSRSQQPYLSSMIMAVYQAEKEKGKDDRSWLEHGYAYALRDHDMWLEPEMRAGDTGLSRYYDFGEGPAPESLKDETNHYRKVVEYFLDHPDQAAGHLVERQPGEKSHLGPGATYLLRLCDGPDATTKLSCDDLQEISLSADFYKGDRAMRESGFDISFRFGPFGADTHHYAAVCLNSLLYKSEMDLAEMSEILGKKAEAASWRQQAGVRRTAINKYLWDDSKGEFFDYDFTKNTRSHYEYITTYYPLWAGLATPEQAKAVVGNLKDFEQPGGAVMSPYRTGAQWDFPYAWAPTQMILVDGLRRYAFTADADRIAFKFADMVAENYAKDGYIVEKYDAVTRSTDSAVTSGYSINVIGFGWTNAAYLEFLNEVPQAKRAELMRIH
ncbi:MAG TPA: trehalase family glycosidase [Verrucomicrobiae bacterium]|nr:trehalase family glycosidase [Verrucomicrobiae bacterium]